VLVRNAQVSIVDVEITGAVTLAIDFNQAAGGGVTGSNIHDNPGAALMIGAGASPRIAHNVFARNGLSERARASLIIENDAEPSFADNVFQGVTPKVFQSLGDAGRLSVMRENWFPDGAASRTTTSAFPRDRQGR
jgi:hypothetical protein